MEAARAVRPLGVKRVLGRPPGAPQEDQRAADWLPGLVDRPALGLRDGAAAG